MHKMLYDVTDERVRVNNAQIERKNGVPGSVVAMKIADVVDGRCLMVQFDITGTWHATGRYFSIENNCLVEVLNDKS